jgi:hypothetical protein
MFSMAQTAMACNVLFALGLISSLSLNILSFLYLLEDMDLWGPSWQDDILVRLVYGGEAARYVSLSCYIKRCTTHIPGTIFLLLTPIPSVRLSVWRDAHGACELMS